MVMGILYSPLLIVVAYLETREARRIRWNRRRGEEDDDDVQEWEHVAEEVDFDLDDTWQQNVRESTPNVAIDSCSFEITQLREQVRELTDTVKVLADEKRGESPGANGGESNADGANQQSDAC